MLQVTSSLSHDMEDTNGACVAQTRWLWFDLLDFVETCEGTTLIHAFSYLLFNVTCSFGFQGHPFHRPFHLLNTYFHLSFFFDTSWVFVWPDDPEDECLCSLPQSPALKDKAPHVVFWIHGNLYLSLCFGCLIFWSHNKINKILSFY